MYWDAEEKSERELERERRRKYDGDVSYNVWRGGGNPDRINSDRQYSAYDEGVDADTFSNRVLREQRQARDRKREQENEEY